jgi:hypothetical protein
MGGGELVNGGCGAPANGFEAKGVELELGPYELNHPSCPGRGE